MNIKAQKMQLNGFTKHKAIPIKMYNIIGYLLFLTNSIDKNSLLEGAFNCSTKEYSEVG